LKADKIGAKDLGLVMVYLQYVNAPSVYFQYTILRVHQNIHKMHLIDIAVTGGEVFHLHQDEKIEKMLRRIENHVELTNTKVLLSNPGGNIKAVSMLYQDFAHYRAGSPPFWGKLEEMLE